MESGDGSKGLYMLRADNAAAQSATSVVVIGYPSNLDVTHQLGSIAPVREHYTTSELV